MSRVTLLCVPLPDQWRRMERLKEITFANDTTQVIMKSEAADQPMNEEDL